MRRIERLGLVTAITGLALLSAAFGVGLAAPRGAAPHDISVAWLAGGGR